MIISAYHRITYTIYLYPKKLVTPELQKELNRIYRKDTPDKFNNIMNDVELVPFNYSDDKRSKPVWIHKYTLDELDEEEISGLKEKCKKDVDKAIKDLWYLVGYSGLDTKHLIDINNLSEEDCEKLKNIIYRKQYYYELD